MDIEVVVVADLFHASFGIMRQVNEDFQSYDTFGSPFVIRGIPNIFFRSCEFISIYIVFFQKDRAFDIPVTLSSSLNLVFMFLLVSIEDIVYCTLMT